MGYPRGSLFLQQLFETGYRAYEGIGETHLPDLRQVFQRFGISVVVACGIANKTVFGWPYTYVLKAFEGTFVRRFVQSIDLDGVIGDILLYRLAPAYILFDRRSLFLQDFFQGWIIQNTGLGETCLYDLVQYLNSPGFLLETAEGIVILPVHFIHLNITEFFNIVTVEIVGRKFFLCFDHKD